MTASNMERCWCGIHSAATRHESRRALAPRSVVGQFETRACFKPFGDLRVIRPCGRRGRLGTTERSRGTPRCAGGPAGSRGYPAAIRPAQISIALDVRVDAKRRPTMGPFCDTTTANDYVCSSRSRSKNNAIQTALSKVEVGRTIFDRTVVFLRGATVRSDYVFD